MCKTTLGLMVTLACWTEVLDLISCWDSKCTLCWLVFLQSLVFFVVGVVLLWQGLDGQADPHQHGCPVPCSNPRYDVLHRDQAHPLCQEPVPLPLFEEGNMTCSCAEQFLYVLAVKGCDFSMRSGWRKRFHVCLEGLIRECKVDNRHINIILSSELVSTEKERWMIFSLCIILF